jgi:ribosomal protein L11 methyltransferase
VEAAGTPLADVEGRFDVVLANIGVRVLGALAADLVRRVRPGGLLVLAGLLDVQVDPLLASAYPQAVELERLNEEGWAATVLQQ